MIVIVGSNPIKSIKTIGKEENVKISNKTIKTSFCTLFNFLKEYFVWFAPCDGKPYIDLLLQKIYHPTEEDYQKDEILKLSSLR